MRTLMVVAAFAAFSSGAFAADKKAERPSVYFVEPKHRSVVGSEFKVVMGVRGKEVRPAGPIDPSSGHHHLLINTKAIPKGAVIPEDSQHLHFDKGETETVVKLPPGKHTLRLQFGNGANQSYGASMGKMITVTVK